MNEKKQSVGQRALALITGGKQSGANRPYNPQDENTWGAGGSDNHYPEEVWAAIRLEVQQHLDCFLPTENKEVKRG